MFNFWWLAGLFNGLEPPLPSLSSQKNKILVFGLCSTSGDWPRWSIDLNPVCHPSPVKKMKCLFSDYFQLLMIGQAVQWTWTPSACPLQPKKLNAHFWIMFNFWWSAGLFNWLKPHLPHLSSQKKNKMLVFGLCSTFDDWLGCSIDLNPICHPSPAKKENACFWIMFNFWWSAGLVSGLVPLLPPLSSQKNKILVFGLCSTSDDWPCLSIDFNAVCLPSPVKKIKCSFLDYIQLRMISQAGQWTWTPSATPLRPKKLNAHFWIMFNFWWSAGLVNGLKPICHPSPAKKKNKMLVSGLCSTFVDQPGWSVDLNPLCYPSPAKKIKCLFWITFNFWWSATLVDGLKPHLPPLSS